MLNRVVLTGRLVKDPDLRYTPNGIAVSTFTLAVNRAFTNGQGEREADFINCVVWRKPAENVANYLKKGSLAGVDGRLQTRNYEGNDGKRVFVTEVLAESVQFLEPRNDNGQGNTNTGGQAKTQQTGGQGGQNNNNPFTNQNRFVPGDDPFNNTGRPMEIDDSDLPF